MGGGLSPLTAVPLLADSPSPSAQEARPATPEQHWPFPGPEDKATEPPGDEPLPRPVWTTGGDALGDLVTLEPTEPSPPPTSTEPQPGGTPNPESLIDLWQSDEVPPAAAWPLPAAPVSEGPPATLPEEGTLLSLDELPEPPATFCDMEQEEEEEAADVGDAQPRGLGCQHAPQEETPGRETPPITNGEMAPKDGTPGRGEQVSIAGGCVAGRRVGGWGDRAAVGGGPDHLLPPTPGQRGLLQPVPGGGGATPRGAIGQSPPAHLLQQTPR